MSTTSYQNLLPDEELTQELGEIKEEKEELLSEAVENEPKNGEGCVYVIFVLYGIATILPWNAVCSCFDFFIAKMDSLKPTSVYPFAVNAC